MVKSGKEQEAPRYIFVNSKESYVQ